MNDVIAVLDPVAGELDHILGHTTFDRQKFADGLERCLAARQALFASGETPSEERVADYLQAGVQVLQMATTIVHLGFNQPSKSKKTIRRARMLRELEALRGVYDLAEQATRHPDAKTRFYDGREARAALEKLVDGWLAAAGSGAASSYPIRGGVVETFLGADGRWTPDATRYDKTDTLRVAAFVRETWLD